MTRPGCSANSLSNSSSIPTMGTSINNVEMFFDPSPSCLQVYGYTKTKTETVTVLTETETKDLTLLDIFRIILKVKWILEKIESI